MPHHPHHHHHHLIKSCPIILRHHHHHLNGSLGAALVVEADEAKAFALVRSSVNEHLGVNCEGSYIMMMMMKILETVEKTLELMTFPKGRNICINSASPNSWKSLNGNLN